VFFIVLVNSYQSLQRQDLAWNTFLFSVVLYLTIEIIFAVVVIGNSASSLLPSYVLLFGAVCVFVLTEWMNARARHRALEKVANDEKTYEGCWNEVRKSKDEEAQLKELNDTNLKPISKKLEKTCSVDVLQDCQDIDVLYARAEFINDAFQSLVSILLETELPAVCDGDSLKSSLFKKELGALFAEDDVGKVIKRMQAHSDNTAVLEQKSFKGSAAAQPNEQTSQSPPLPGQPYGEVAVDIEGSTAKRGTQDRNGTTFQETVTSGDGPAAANVQSDAKLDSDHVQKIQGADNEPPPPPPPPVKVRRGPVKLPSRAIAKVSYTLRELHILYTRRVSHLDVCCSSFPATALAVIVS
jgi:hypothetical protein